MMGEGRYRMHISLCGHPAWDRRRYTDLRCQWWDLLKCGNLSLEILDVFDLWGLATKIVPYFWNEGNVYVASYFDMSYIKEKKIYLHISKHWKVLAYLFYCTSHYCSALKIRVLHFGIRAPVENTRACWEVSLSGDVVRLWVVCVYT